MANPSITELQNSEKYELIAELNHTQIKEFILKQVANGGWLIKSYMVYQAAMLVLGIFLFTYTIALAFRGKPESLFFLLGALIFCFSLLIVIHELLHGIAIKLVGAPKVNYGGYLKKFIFYAEADQYVLNRRQFAFIALAPLVVIKLITLLGILLFWPQPFSCFLAFVMSAHSLFCAGDIGLLSLFFRFKNEEVFTFDVQSKKQSYYYRKKH